METSMFVGEAMAVSFANPMSAEARLWTFFRQQGEAPNQSKLVSKPINIINHSYIMLYIYIYMCVMSYNHHYGYITTIAIYPYIYPIVISFMTLINPNSLSATWSTSSSAFRPHLKGQMLASTMVYDESVLLKFKKNAKNEFYPFFRHPKLGISDIQQISTNRFTQTHFKNPWIPHLVLQISVPSRRPTSAGESSCSSKHSKRPEKLGIPQIGCQ